RHVGLPRRDRRRTTLLRRRSRGSGRPPRGRRRTEPRRGLRRPQVERRGRCRGGGEVEVTPVRAPPALQAPLGIPLRRRAAAHGYGQVTTVHAEGRVGELVTEVE